MNTLKEGIKLKGVWKITKAKLVKPEHFALNNKIAELQNELHEARENDDKEAMQELEQQIEMNIRFLNSICETEIKTIENLIPTVGRTAIADHLTNPAPSPSTLRINYTSLGTSSTAPANGNTQLGTETFRKLTASATKSNNIAYITAFYTASEVSGTFEEFGLHIAGTASANSGTLFSRITTTIVKTVTETLTIDYTITIT